LAIEKLRWASEATCGRWVMQMTWRPAARSRSCSPTARVVGERLRALGQGRQVICITHLPQVASLADTHFRLEKDLDGEQAVATVERLEGEGVVEEIRRMLGGAGSDDAATRHARELLAAA
jgi:DNA repair protein RecN (Recombination protein N)